MTRSPGPDACVGRNFTRWLIAVVRHRRATHSSPFWASLLLGVLAFSMRPAPVEGTLCFGNGEYVEQGNESASFPQCSILKVCQQPVISVHYELTDLFCDPMADSCSVRARVAMKFPGNHQNDPSASGFAYSFATVLVTRSDGSLFDACGVSGATIRQDKGEYSVAMSVSCDQAAIDPAAYRLNLEAIMCPCAPGTFCPWASCEKKTSEPLDFADNPALQCVPKAPNRCETSSGSGGCNASRATGALSCPLKSPRASFIYHAGGVGNANLPGTAGWRTSLGRNISHDYAERIVQDPNNAERVWLMTREGIFREFRDMQTDGSYEYAAPSDEKRALRRADSGWTLTELDGTMHTFDASGLWLSTLDPHGVGKTATYTGGVLTRVDMPDGQHELFGYHPDGKLATVTKVGIDGTSSRVWRYAWTGDDLVRVDLPSGEAQRLLYEDPRHPGFLTQLLHVGTNGSTRIESAAEYDAAGRAVRIWRGSTASGPNGPVPGPNAVDLWSHRFLDLNANGLVTRVEVTDPLGGVSVHELSRDPRSEAPRLVSTSGDCPACGLGPNSRLTYGDPANPLRPTQVLDGRGTATIFTYDSNGLPLTRTEAAGTSLARTTRWEYNGPFPSLVTAAERPSTTGTGARRARLTYDGQGNLTSRTQEGVEAGSAFRFTTDYRYNIVGQLEETDPPGYGTQDVTRIAFDPARGNLIPTTRTDPLIGATSFSYDPFNRRTAVTDPNGMRTLTSYDELNRVTAVTQEGETPAESLTTLYEHNAFGDLARTILPRGNVIEYGYDAAGRLISIEKKPDRATPGERTFYTLDSYGHRIREDQQRWDGTAWVTDSATAYEYSSRCHLDKVLHADGGVTENAYDCNANLERVWDANHPSDNRANPATTTYTYDALNRLTSSSQPWAGTGGGTALTRYEYDVQDHLVMTTDAEGNVTRYTYSDRDLMTQQVSEVSGTTEHHYNEHGNLTTETDARGITVSRTVDSLGRATFIDYPEDALDTRYTFDDPLTAFSKGRLTAIIRNGTTVPYRYDRFGRALQDGALTYEYDANGNLREIGYPGGVTASYTFDFADREERLVLNEPGQSSQTLASSAAYLANGPLASFLLGNGLVEIRTFDGRYFPSSIRVPGKLDWEYGTDRMGNILSIQDALTPSQPRSYAYQDYAYFLAQGNGPWGNLAWTYDKIGNRLTQAEDGATEAYSYHRNAVGGNSPKLVRVAPPLPSEPTSYVYDASGNQTHRSAGERKLRLSYNAEGLLSRMASDVAGQAPAATQLRYDGRGFLDLSTLSPGAGSVTQVQTAATYSSAGLLFHKFTQSQPAAPAPRDLSIQERDSYILYFSGRPVALFEKSAVIPHTAPRTDTRHLLFLTTDHLGTPVLATEETGNSAWTGGFSVFGEDFTQAQEIGLFLRFPGQWTSDAFQGTGRHGELYYNLHRWYEPRTGRYASPDPLSLPGMAPTSFLYANSNPLFYRDPMGLLALAPGSKCRRFDGAVRDLKEALKNAGECCLNWLNNILGADLAAMLDDPNVLVDVTPKIQTGAGGATDCDVSKTSFRIRPELCDMGQGKRLRHVLLHEMAHLGDCAKQKFPEGGMVEEGGVTEMHCLGAVLDRKPLFRPPYWGVPVYGPPLFPEPYDFARP